MLADIFWSSLCVAIRASPYSLDETVKLLPCSHSTFYINCFIKEPPRNPYVDLEDASPQAYSFLPSQENGALVVMNCLTVQ